jgi:hypothetical protein
MFLLVILKDGIYCVVVLVNVGMMGDGCEGRLWIGWSGWVIQ